MHRHRQRTKHLSAPPPADVAPASTGDVADLAWAGGDLLESAPASAAWANPRSPRQRSERWMAVRVRALTSRSRPPGGLFGGHHDANVLSGRRRSCDETSSPGAPRPLPGSLRGLELGEVVCAPGVEGLTCWTPCSQPTSRRSRPRRLSWRNVIKQAEPAPGPLLPRGPQFPHKSGAGRGSPQEAHRRNGTMRYLSARSL
jgi:hypothetical protein